MLRVFLPLRFFLLRVRYHCLCLYDTMKRFVKRTSVQVYILTLSRAASLYKQRRINFFLLRQKVFGLVLGHNERGACSDVIMQQGERILPNSRVTASTFNFS